MFSKTRINLCRSMRNRELGVSNRYHKIQITSDGGDRVFDKEFMWYFGG